jgi:antitoxin ParD1/3/4
MGTNVSLTPELEIFAKECVASGRYNNVSEVVRDGLRMVQDAEERKKAFMRSLTEAREESEREGWVEIDDLAAEMDALLEAAEKRNDKSAA